MSEDISIFQRKMVCGPCINHGKVKMAVVKEMVEEVCSHFIVQVSASRTGWYATLSRRNVSECPVLVHFSSGLDQLCGDHW